jgi:hypothetical protein
VVPSVGLGGGGSFGAPGPDANGLTQIGANIHEPTVTQPSATSAAGGVTPSTKTSTKSRVDLASNKAPGAQVPVVLAIIAIIALALVAGSYARLYLLRREA